MLHGHGDDGYRYGREFKANFSSNVWLPTRLEALRDHLFARFNCGRVIPRRPARVWSR